MSDVVHSDKSLFTITIDIFVPDTIFSSFVI